MHLVLPLAPVPSWARGRQVCVPLWGLCDVVSQVAATSLNILFNDTLGIHPEYAGYAGMHRWWWSFWWCSSRGQQPCGRAFTRPPPTHTQHTT
jgi:hypothetical protein